MCHPNMVCYIVTLIAFPVMCSYADPRLLNQNDTFQMDLRFPVSLSLYFFCDVIQSSFFTNGILVL